MVTAETSKENSIHVMTLKLFQICKLRSNVLLCWHCYLIQNNVIPGTANHTYEKHFFQQTVMLIKNIAACVSGFRVNFHN